MKVIKTVVLAIIDTEDVPVAIVYSDGRQHTFLECRRIGTDSLHELLGTMVGNNKEQLT